ncbi:NUDIX hydrolase [Hydrogenophilus thermoluteolus]|uniref:Phosphatase NudJ n=1 Tax=Hydrogenophilus thermoluteolus TaxID=297 RepID=Q9WXC6_HYDTE|nr:NUDIX hydrolase [Hydrogenophilus thermoluteolus]HCO77702.1 NUDIX hydrolase [Rhodocyclaceae bacterium]MBW7656725.1 NUDIX hydrolase [Hydrogenophilus thermoluteolus]BAA76604.1 MutT-like protein [Hydrogenophilus thermoluteolus]BBD77108.1 MutT-like protein [Hydrogenophilus thermoluteolus]GLW60146.1 NUDIX hydrolase [Hydrogenophilus thermoluteolus]
MSERWRPGLTVAAVIEREGQFLLVEEETPEGVRFNQPAGHVEPGETLVAAVVRETLEETRFHFTPKAVVGVYLWQKPGSETAYLRFAFSGQLGTEEPNRALDSGIIRPVWLSRDEVAALAQAGRTRSPLVLAVIDDWLAGRRYSLDVVRLWRDGVGLVV